MKVYGWTELNIHCHSIDTMTVDYNRVLLISDETGKVTIASQDGEWFRTFADAKRVAVRHFTCRIKECRAALSRVKGIRKATVEHSE